MIRRGFSPRALCAALSLVAAVSVVASAQGRPVVREEDSEARRKALIQMWDAVPGSDEPRSGATFSAWLRTQPSATRAAAMAINVPTVGVWSSIGPLGFYGDNGFFGSLPQLDAGRVPAVAFHPTDRNTIFVGTAAGGVWKSTNEGASWMPLTDTQCSQVIGSVAVDPVNPNIVYAGTGEFYESTAGCGVLRSSDGGTTWSNVAAEPFASSAPVFFTLIVDRATAGSTNSTTLLAATNRGVYRSTNSGVTWTLTTPALTFTDVVQHPTNPNIVYAMRMGVAGSATGPGLWKSTDKGATWTTVSTMTADSVGRMEMAVSAARPGSVWIVAATTSRTFGGLYRWDDSTASRSTLAASGVTAPPAVTNRNNFGAQGDYDLMIAVDPTNANRIYLGGVRAYRSVDGGGTFREIAPNIHCDWHVIVVDPNDPTRILAGSDGGLFLSRDGAETFNAINAGLATSLHYPGLSLHPTDPSGVLTGMQDNGTIIARNGMTQWNGVWGGDGGYTAINPTAPDIYYVSSQNGSMVRINAAAGTAANVVTGIDAAERRAFIAPFIIDGSRPNRLYFGGTKVYRTDNEGTRWTAISGDLTKGSPAYITALAVAPSDSATLLAGTSDGNIRYSRDYGLTWASPSTALPVRSVGDFAISPTDPAKAVVTFTSTGTGHVYLTTDGGYTWTNITGSLPDVTTQASAWGPNGKLFIGNMYGVYETSDLGVTWTRASGLPWIRVTDLVYNSRTNRLVAATYGRGIWAFDFSTAAAVKRGDVNGDGVVNAADALLIQQALVGMQVLPTAQIFPAGDANCDGKLDVLDAITVLRYAVNDGPAGACVGTTR
ncbi:MAG: dockerin type I domain-containing protein [Gemmatimonadaceae bacterium]